MLNWLKPKEFNWLNKQGVESKKGFSVQFTGRYSAEYAEGDRKISLSIESGLSDDKPCIIISPDAFECWDGDSHDKQIPNDQKTVMLANLRRALEFQDLALVIEEPLSMYDSIASQREQYLDLLQAGKRVTINGREINSEKDFDDFLSELNAT